jgi:dihydroorotase
MLHRFRTLFRKHVFQKGDTMKKTLIQNGYIVDPGSGREGLFDLLIEDGIVKNVAKGLTADSDCETLDAGGRFVVPGFIDLQVNPGRTIEYIADILPSCGITTPLIMPCNVNGLPIMEYYGSLKGMLDACEGQTVNIATAVSIEPPDTGGHETYAKLGVPLDEIGKRMEEFIDLGITAIGEVVLPLGGTAHVTSEMSGEFLDKLLDETGKYDIPILLHTGAGMKGIRQAVEICAGRRMHLCHVGSTCAGDSIAKAISLLEDNPNITTDTHLSEVAGSTSRSSKLVLEYFEKGEVVKVNPETFEATPIKDLASAEPPFYYNKVNLFENNVTCALSDRVEAIECDELGDGIRARIMLKNLFKLVNSVALEHARIKLLRRLIAKLTVNPARILKISRGTLGEGVPADVVILDLKEERVKTVFVNGEKVLDEGIPTGRKPGRRILYKG